MCLNVLCHKVVSDKVILYSPYLFTLCAECLSVLITSEGREGSLGGCRVAKLAPPIFHLFFFADESLIFSKASLNACREIKNILEVYERASGQCVNFNKSTMLFNPNVFDYTKLELGNVL